MPVPHCYSIDKTVDISSDIHEGEMQMLRRKILPFFLAFTIILLSGGCADLNRFPAVGTYFLCATGADYAPGVHVLAPDGSPVFSLRNTLIEMCVAPDGMILDQTAGAIAKNSLLFIRIRKDRENYQTGVWSVADQDWAVEPQDGLSAYTADDKGHLLSFVLSSGTYDLNCQPLSEDSEDPEEVFSFANGLVLYNRKNPEGYSYITDENGDCLFDTGIFYEKNSEYLYDLALFGVISVDQIILGEYMIVECKYTEIQEDGTDLISTASFLCDPEGHIQFTEWDYLNVWFPQNQYRRTDHNMYLRFDCGEERQPHFLRLEGMQEAVFPENCEDIIYQDKDLFLLESSSGEYTVYDAYSRTKGASFSGVTPGLQNIFLFGTDSYVVQGLNREATTIVIDDVVYPLSDGDEMAFVTSGEYPVISTGKLGGSVSLSYILDPEGSMVLTTPDYVIYADHSHYLILRDDRFQINTYNSF